MWIGRACGPIRIKPLQKELDVPVDRAALAISIRDDIALCSAQFENTSCHVYPTPSQKMASVADQSIAVIVTSPPYLNNFDYAEMTRMYLYFWCLVDSVGL